MNKYLVICFALATSLPLFQPLKTVTAQDFTVVVDYTYDTNNFFDTQAKRDAMQAAADRYSEIIDSKLDAVGPAGTASGTDPDWRIGFFHPGTGDSFELSTASSQAADSLFAAGDGNFPAAADEYGFPGLNENEWILFAGGRPLVSTGVGGTGSGTNFASTFEDPNGPLRRGVIPVTSGDAVNDQPAWGGSISFDSGTSWHFDLTTPATGGDTDFYTIALHEIGHAFGLNSSSNQWESTQVAENFFGSETLLAYNDDNGTNLTSLFTVSPTNLHWEDGTYDSEIFAAGNPIFVGTVGAGNLQDLLMEPIANFTPSVRRFELTNTDVAALRDLSWSTIPNASILLGDVNVNGVVDFLDIAPFIAVLSSANFQAEADCNEDGIINFSDISVFISILAGS